MRITREGIEARINYKVETTIFEASLLYATNIKLVAENHTLEEVEQAIAKIKEIVADNEKGAKVLLNSIKG